jgi:hypothetical protein
MFPGESDPCNWGTNGEEPYGPINWTENTAGNEPNDRRGLSSMGPFTLEPGSMHKVDFALVTARGDEGPLSSVELLKVYIDSVKSSYYRNTDYFGYQWLGTDDITEEPTVNNLKVYPSPASTHINIVYDGGATTLDYSLINIYGKQIRAGKKVNTGFFTIALEGLDKGIYILNIRDGKQVLNTKFIKN